MLLMLSKTLYYFPCSLNMFLCYFLVLGTLLLLLQKSISKSFACVLEQQSHVVVTR